MEIVYLIPEFPSQTHTFFWRERVALQQLGVRTHLVSTRRPSSTKLAPHDWTQEAIAETFYLADVSLKDAPQIAAQFVRFGPKAWVKVFTAALNGCPVKFWLSNIFLIAASVRLVGFMRDRKLTHIHSHSCGDSALIALFASCLDRISYSLTLHANLHAFGRQQNIKWKNAAFAIAITSQLRDQVLSELPFSLPSRIGVAPMGVDPSVFKRSQPYQPWQPGEVLHVFTCGRLNASKGHQDLIEAVSVLVKSGWDVRLEIAGEDQDGAGGFHKVLERLIAELDLKSNVHLLGAISEQQVVKCLQQSHLFVLASHHEALGVAIMEALSCELPVIATRVGGVPDLIDHGTNGCLVPARDAANLAEAIERLATDAHLAASYADNGRRTILERFSSENSARELKKQLEKLK